jgi:hypothetical protein
MITDLCAETSHAFHHCGKVNLSIVRISEAVLISIPDIGDYPGGTDDRFGGDTTDIEAVASKKMPFYKGNLCSKSCCTGRCHETSRARSNYDKVITLRRFGILPVLRMDVGNQFEIVLIFGLNHYLLAHQTASFLAPYWYTGMAEPEKALPAHRTVYLFKTPGQFPDNGQVVNGLDARTL